MKKLLIITHHSKKSTPIQGSIVAAKLKILNYHVTIVSSAQSYLGRFLDIMINGFHTACRHDTILINVCGNRAFIYEAYMILIGALLKKQVVAVLRGGWLPEFMEKSPRIYNYIRSKPSLLLTPHEYLSQKVHSFGISVHGKIPSCPKTEFNLIA